MNTPYVPVNLRILERLAQEAQDRAEAEKLTAWPAASEHWQHVAQTYRDASALHNREVAKSIIAEMEEIGQENVNFQESEQDNGVDFFIGLRNALLISIPIWALIIWGVWYLWIVL